MKQKKFDPDLICPFCAINNVQHNDNKYISCEHVPPRAVFVDKNDRNGLINIPSCQSCNAGTSQQDEQFKVAISIFVGQNTRQKMGLWQKARSSLNNKPNWRKDLWSRRSKILVPTPEGIDYPFGHVVKVDSKPVNEVITKIIRGLHWYITDEVIPPDNKPMLINIKQGDKCNDDVMGVLNKFGKSIEKCGKQFEVIYVIAEDYKYASMWLIRFYDEDFFVGVFRPEEKIAKV